MDKVKDATNPKKPSNLNYKTFGQAVHQICVGDKQKKYGKAYEKWQK